VNTSYPAATNHLSVAQSQAQAHAILQTQAKVKALGGTAAEADLTYNELGGSR
jgi:hypothetical protein